MIETYRRLMSRFRLNDVRKGASVVLTTQLVELYEQVLGNPIPEYFLKFVAEFGFKAFAGHVLFGMAGDESDDYDILWNLRMIRSRNLDLQGDPEWTLTDVKTNEKLAIEDFLPFADCSGMPLMLKVAGNNSGRVYFFAMEEWQMEQISQTFDEFLESLEVST